MIEQNFYLKKGASNFGKQSMPSFDRMPKDYTENEACFIFINNGEVSVPAPEVYIDLNKNSGILPKCFNYYLETKQENRIAVTQIEVVAVL